MEAACQADAHSGKPVELRERRFTAPQRENLGMGSENELALQTIGYLVEDAQLGLIKDATTAKDAWILLRNYYIQDSSVGKVALIKKLSKLELAEGGDMRKHLMELEELFEKIMNAGCRMDEDMKAAFMLASLPASYENTVASIQGRMEVFTVNFVKTKLLEEYGRRKEKQETEDQKALAVGRFPKRLSDVNTKRLCYACGGADHMMRNCPKLQNIRGESSKVADGTTGRHFTKSAVAEEKLGGHVCFAALKEETSHAWYLDSGASAHMTGRAELLDWHKQMGEENVALADGIVLCSNAKGEKELHAVGRQGSIVEVKLKNVLVVPGLSANLVSVQAIAKQGFEIVFTDEECRILKNGAVIIVGRKVGNFYRLDRQEV